MGLENASITLLEEQVQPALPHGARVVCLGVPAIVLPSTGKIDPREYFLGQWNCGSLTCWDYSDFAGDVVHVNLNEPLPDHLRNTADLLIDPGTLEHCFNIGVAFANVVEALDVGGIAFHVNPANWIDHGFYNICPCFYHDAYAANGFEDIRVYGRHMDNLTAVRMNDVRHTKMLSSTDRQLFHAIAVKAIDQPFVMPMQERYAKGHWRRATTEVTP